ncbi:MAG: chemotaxis response regulator protein-glutamate methylesterase [Deltaproteobacteria bacterium]
MAKIRLLIVDDSALMRKIIKQMAESDPDIEVVGTARDGLEGTEMAAALTPDVITMDVEMPRMTGLEALSIIMHKTPTPVIMLSSLTAEGAKSTFDALEAGAVDYIAKNLATSSFDLMKVQEELVSKIKAVARRRVRAINPGVLKRPEPIVAVRKSFATQKIAFVAIGASTGGPRAVQEVISKLPGDMTTGLLIAIHMPKAFTGAFAERLNELSALSVKEAVTGDKVLPGHVLLTPGGRQTRIRKRGLMDFCVEVSDEPKDSLYKPCVDIAMKSVAECYPGRSLGVILTGMGHDGLEGMRMIKEKGGKTLAQNEQTCTVYGMPKAVVDAGIADKTAPLDMIAAEILNMI